MIKNLAIIHVIPSLNPGGAERMAVLLAIEQRRRGNEVQILALGGGPAQALEKLLYDEEVPYDILDKRPGFSLAILRDVSRHLRNFDPEIIHTHQHVLPYVLFYAMRQHGRVRVVHTVHTLAEHELPLFHRWLYRCGYRRGVSPVAIAREVARSIQAVYGGDPPIVIPNGIPIPSHGRSIELSNETARRFVMVARMSPPKDHPTLLRAFARVRANIPDVELYLIGDGADRGTLGNLVAELGLDGSVHFLGFRADVQDLLETMDVFVLASRWEGNPLSVMEAMAAGLPVIASSVGGVPELVTDGVNGFLVPASDVGSLQVRLEQLAIVPGLHLEMGRRAREKAVANFSVKVMADGYLKHYARLLDGIK